MTAFLVLKRVLAHFSLKYNCKDIASIIRASANHPYHMVNLIMKTHEHALHQKKTFFGQNTELISKVKKRESGKIKYTVLKPRL